MVTNYVRQRWELLGLHTVNSTGSKSDNNPLGEVRTAARERAIGFLDFLEALYALRYPPVRDIGSYRDILVRRADLSDVVGITLNPGGEVWLTADLPNKPDPLEPPHDLAEWIAGPIVAGERPTARHPNTSMRRILELLESPPIFNGIAMSIYDLDSDKLAGLNITGISPDTIQQVCATALDERRNAERAMEQWTTTVWEPWASFCKAVERSRNIYKMLFDLRNRMERERDAYECLWGFARLRWTLATGEIVDHPIACVPVEFDLDKDNGQIAVAPNGATIIDQSWAADLPLTDRAGFNELRNEYEDAGFSPWDEEAATFLTKLLRTIDYDGIISHAGDSGHQAEHHPVLHPDDWVLYVRRRQPNLLGFLQQQRRLYSDPATTIPDPFAALVVDEPSVFDIADTVVPAGNGVDPPAIRNDRMLLPLASNNEQMQILTRARTGTGVTVQGPPGTGKSHTIANLISHYIACGQRVLVTAAKEQALAVLIDKVPEAIRALCVPVLGTDAAARSRLQATITAITDAAFHGTDTAEISRLEAELDDIEYRIAVATNELKSCRAAEVEPVPNPPHGWDPNEWTPSAAAKWLADNEARLSGIPDQLHHGAPVPITSQEMAELVDLCTTLDEDDSQAALLELPDPATLPAGAQLAELHLEASGLRQQLASLDDWVTDWTKVDSVSQGDLDDLAGSLDQWAAWFMKVRGTWVERVIKDAADPSLAVGWSDFYTASAEEREIVLAAGRALAAHTVEINVRNNTSPTNPDFQEALKQAQRSVARGSPSAKLPRALRNQLKCCRVDGHLPASADDYTLLSHELNRLVRRQRLSARWDNIVTRFGAPPLKNDYPVEDQIGEYISIVYSALAWRITTWPQFVDQLNKFGIAAPATVQETEAIAGIAEICRKLAPRVQLRELTRKLDAIADRLRIAAAAPEASLLWQELLTAFESEDFDSWDHQREAARRLLQIRPRATRRNKLLSLLSSSAPQLAAQVVAGNQDINVEHFEAAWMWRQLEVWFGAIARSKEPTELQDLLEQLAQDRHRVTTDLVAARAWMALATSIDDRRRRALNRFITANRKLGKGTGRYAPHWEEELRAGMDDAKDAVPAWIMPIHRVFSSFRPATDPPFDVLIIDEASQIGILEVPVLALAKKAIIVGDDQQTSPENVGTIRQEVFDLIDDYLQAIHDRRTRFDSDNSLYDIARQQFPRVVQLREHFRCLPKIISFSNHYWYNDTIVPLRDRPPRPGWQALGSVFVPGGVRRRSDDTNSAEAQAIIDLIGEFAADPDYSEKSFGIITLLGSGQAPLINGMLVDRFGPSVIEERKLRVGDPASFQGDERDIMIISLVVSHDLDDPDRSIGAMNRANDARRINVAASRARDQLWIVHSVQPDSMHSNDPRRALLEHCLSGNDGFTTDNAGDTVMDRTESQFERDVLTRIRDAGYTRVIAQYPVGNYRIDLVVEGPESRLGIECDGDRWHGPDAWDRDRTRQAVLERAGWTFVRIRGSAFYRNRSQALRPLWERLDHLEIPKGDWMGKASDIGIKMHRKWPDDFPHVSNDHTTLVINTGTAHRR